MKYRILLWMFLAGVLFACRDDEPVRFDVPVEFKQPLSFREIPGGAVMRYKLPDDSDIFGVRVRYDDAFGNALVKDGTYLSDSLVLSGFTEARDKETNPVIARLSFFNKAMEENDPVEVRFGTLPSATVAVFDNIQVKPFWGGFGVTYTAPEDVSGMLHIFYLGVNPKTKEPDSILIASLPIAEGGDTLNYQMTQVMDSTQVIVRADDFKGYRVKQRVFDKMPCLSMDTLTAKDFDFSFTGNIYENEEYEIGRKYLFNGDKKGITYMRNRMDGQRYKYATFIAGPYAFFDEEDPEGNRFIVDLRDGQIPAAVNLYAFLYYGSSWPYKGPNLSIEYPDIPCDLWNKGYRTRLPSKIRLYGTNEDPETVDLGRCAKLFDLDEGSSEEDFRASWARRTDDFYGTAMKEDGRGYDGWYRATDEELAAAEPVVLNMLCNYTGETYRYLIFVVEDTFDGYNNYHMPEERNGKQYISFAELEVCVKANPKNN